MVPIISARAGVTDIPEFSKEQGAVAGGSTEGVTPFFGPAALTNRV